MDIPVDPSRHERLIQLFGQVTIEALVNNFDCTIKTIETDFGKILQFHFIYHITPDELSNGIMFDLQDIMQAKDITSYIQSCKDTIHRMVDRMEGKRPLL
jgi:hypothetical protein